MQPKIQKWLKRIISSIITLTTGNQWVNADNIVKEVMGSSYIDRQ